ncbi:ABC transporter permease [Nocardioides alcanivorans]|uniref:ABC transporter permease n=1 Tax=Nocardioides alcanivorans TaxID=2897352 RepID=UPI001F2AC889|nr:ABC transporter permease [Nocardioides alcanivorans]
MSDQSGAGTVEAAPPPEPDEPTTRGGLTAWLPTVVDTIVAIGLALIIGAILIIFSTEDVIDSLGYFFSYPWDFFRFAGTAVWDAYSSLVDGAVGSGTAIRRTLERAAPLICAGLGVSLAFRSGLFNIGAQGQMLLGALAGGYVGFHYDLPPGIHLVAALLAALVAGGLYGGIAGLLKARTGAHEVIVTIMLNHVAGFIVLYFLAKDTFQRPNSNNLLTPPVADSASFPSVGGLHLGVILALVAAGLVWWLLERSTLGFEMRAVGANPDAARTAGMSVARVYVAGMMIAGMLAALAVTMNVLGRQDAVTENIAGQVGFEAITVALLGRATPLGTVLAGLLFGALSSGGLAMQSGAGVPPEMAQVLQALIVLFVAAPALIRGITRMRGGDGGGTVMAKGWGG